MHNVPTAAAALCLLAGPLQAQTAAEIDFAREILAGIQQESILRNREYCGLIGYNAAGDLVATGPHRGRRTGCRPRIEPDGMTVTASYHTHAAYDVDYENELPSPDDIAGDMDEGINGFLATPGGRFWVIDGRTGESRQICGVKCLPWDHDFRRDTVDPVAERYTLKTLLERFED